MNAYEVTCHPMDGIPVFHIQGYFSDATGRDLQEAVEAQVRAGKFVFVVDFSKCTVINSPGLSTFLDLTLKVVDDFKGRIILSGLDRLKLSVMEMTGVTGLAQVAKDISEGVAKASAAA